MMVMLVLSFKYMLETDNHFFIAGDYVKFNFPMAQALTTLAWGGITYEGGYVKAGMMNYLRDAVKWGTDYFLKCHVSPNELYGQVGDGHIDHAWWGRPEDMTMERPGMKIYISLILDLILTLLL